MSIYKPYEILFCTIETIWDKTGVGGFYQSVSGLVATFQWLNIFAIINLINKEVNYIYIIAIYLGLLIFNWIYFKDKRINEILWEFKNNNRQIKIIYTIIVSLYFIASFVVFILTMI